MQCECTLMETIQSSELRFVIYRSSGLGRRKRLPYLHGNLLDNFDAVSFQANHFAGMVGEEPDGVQSEIGEDLGAEAALVLELALAVRSA